MSSSQDKPHYVVELYQPNVTIGQYACVLPEHLVLRENNVSRVLQLKCCIDIDYENVNEPGGSKLREIKRYEYYSVKILEKFVNKCEGEKYIQQLLRLKTTSKNAAPKDPNEGQIASLVGDNCSNVAMDVTTQASRDIEGSLTISTNGNQNGHSYQTRSVYKNGTHITCVENIYHNSSSTQHGQSDQNVSSLDNSPNQRGTCYLKRLTYGHYHHNRPTSVNDHRHQKVPSSQNGSINGHSYKNSASASYDQIFYKQETNIVTHKQNMHTNTKTPQNPKKKRYISKVETKNKIGHFDTKNVIKNHKVKPEISFERKLKDQVKKNTELRPGEFSTQDWMLRYQRSIPVKELIEGSGIFIPEVDLNHCLIHAYSMNHLARKLFRQIFHNDAIKKCNYFHELNGKAIKNIVAYSINARKEKEMEYDDNYYMIQKQLSTSILNSLEYEFRAIKNLNQEPSRP